MRKQFTDMAVINSILQNSRIGLWSIELDEGAEPRMYVDETFCEIMDMDVTLTPEEVYRFWYDHVDELYRQSVNTSVEKMMQGKYAEVRYPWKHPSGRVIYVRCGGVLDKEYSRGIRLCGSHQDVSEVVQVTGKIQEQENELCRQAEITKSLADIYLIVAHIDLEKDRYKIIARDAAMPEKMPEGTAGATMKYIMENMADFEYVDSMVAFVEVETIAKRLAEKRLISCEYYGRNRKWYQASFIVSARDAEGKTEHVLFVIQDVDEKKQKEVAQMQALADALIAAEHASQAKTTFLSNMSHDIRTPMNAIIGFTTLAQSHVEQPELVKNYLEKIMTSSNHLLSLINDVLDMSRIESGTVKLEEKECRLSEILRDIVSIVQGDIHSKQLEFYMDSAEVVNESVICDKLRVDRILLNCLNNAIKFTEPGGTVGVRLIQKQGAPEGYADFDFLVCDTGIGMSPEFVRHIFEPFTREQTSTVSGISGTGLGMAITKNIVEMMGGTISVVSEVGVGSEFTISLRFRLGKDDGKGGIIPELEGKKALVAENHKNASENVSRLLERLGLQPEIVNSGKEAVQRVREAEESGRGYHVCVVDRRLSDMSGVEAVRQMHTLAKDKTVMILTVYDPSEVEDSAREAGVTAVCSKPVFLSELRGILTGQQKKKSGPVDKNPDFRGKRLLLVEDNPLNREIAFQILKKYGFVIEMAEDGSIAVERIANAETGYFDAVLMDIQMPVMDGYRATRAIRSLENKKLAEIPIIAMTANAFEEDKKAALDAGMNAHIAKPLNIKALLAVLKEVLDVGEV